MPMPELHTAPALSRLCGIFYFEASKSYFPTPSPFSSWSRSDICLYAYTVRTVPTSQMRAVCWKFGSMVVSEPVLLNPT